MRSRNLQTNHVGVIFTQGASRRWFDSIHRGNRELDERFPHIIENAPKHVQVVDESASEPERTLIGRLVSQFQKAGFDKLVVVTGMHEQAVRKWFLQHKLEIPVTFINHPTAEQWGETLPLVAAALQPQDIAVGVGADVVMHSADFAKIKRKVSASRKPVLRLMFGKRQGSKRRLLRLTSRNTTWIFNKPMAEMMVQHAAEPTSRKGMLKLGARLLLNGVIPFKLIPLPMTGREVINVNDVYGLMRAREYIAEQRRKRK